MTVAGFAARRAAAALLGGVVDRGSSLAEQVAASDGALAALDPPDRARAQALATGALRHLGRIDTVLAGFLQKAPPPPARNALRLAVAELNVDGLPAHAVVDGAVRVVSDSPKGRHLSGLVNAVARKVAAGGTALWDAAPEAPLPGWLEAPLDAAWGAEAVAAIGKAHHSPPPLDLTLRRPAEAAEWAERLGARQLPTGSLRLTARAQVSALPGYEDGAWWVQDAAAAIPVRLFGPLAGRTALDLCAAPGGKTLQLAAGGATVTAVDASALRLGRLRANLARTGLAAEIVVADALDWEPDRHFDAILVDAPCTATGTLRRHPDLPFVRSPAELPGLAELQARLLRRAWRWLAPGGRLVFCTCSLLPAEGEAQAEVFLAENPSGRAAPPDAVALGIDPGWVDSRGGLRLRPDYWPDLGGMDGFYAIALE